MSWYYLNITNEFPTEFVPVVFDNNTVTVKSRGESYMLGLFDAGGQEEYERLCPLSYAQTDVFLVCFSVVAPSSFENIRLKWVPEITHHCPKTPFILVGTMIDLREDSEVIKKLKETNQKPVLFKSGVKMAEEVEASKYVECSALSHKGLSWVFEEAVSAALVPKDWECRRKNKCALF